MYYPFFLAYMLTGLLISLAVFIWALKNRQFTEQQRARFLALENAEPGQHTLSFTGKIQMYGILSLAAAAVAGSAALIAYALFFY